MIFDQNNNATGMGLGKDRMGHITPDLEASDTLRPFLPVPYPAPWLPTLRQDQGHPILANKVISSQMAIGQDKNSCLVPAGYLSGPTGNGSGVWCIVVYGPADVGNSYNAQTGALVATAGEHAVLACPTDAVAGNVTLPDGTVVAVSSGDITFALACDLFPTGKAVTIGIAPRDAYQFIGTVKVDATNSTHGISCVVDGMNPIGYQFLNYMHEMGTFVQTQYVIRVPWIGANRNTLKTLAAADGVVGYKQGYGLSFTHFTGTPKVGQGVVASSALQDAGNYTSFDPTKNAAHELIGRVLGVMNMIKKIGFSNRVKTLWAPERLGGNLKDPNPASIMMGGSATGGIPTDINLHTDAIYKTAKVQGKPIHDEYGTYVLIRVNL